MTILSKWEGEKQSYGDLSRKFMGTYVLASVRKTKPDSYFFNELSETSVSLLNHDDRAVLAGYDEIDILKSNVPPGIRMLGGNSIALVRRIPERQWQQGLCVANTLILKNAEEKLKVINKSLASTLFEAQVDVPLERGLHDVRGCLRLTEKYWIRKEQKTINLFRLRARIGSWCAGQFFWSPVGEVFKQEVADELGPYAE